MGYCVSIYNTTHGNNDRMRAGRSASHSADRDFLCLADSKAYSHEGIRSDVITALEHGMPRRVLNAPDDGHEIMGDGTRDDW